MSKIEKILLIVLLVLMVIAGIVAVMRIGLSLSEEPIYSENTYHFVFKSDVYRFLDEEAGVVCWVVAKGVGVGIDCMSIFGTLLHP